MKLSEIIKSNETVISCRTKEQSIALEKEFKKLGLKWCDGDEYTSSSNAFDSRGASLCYDPFKGEYASAGFYDAKDFTIIPFDEVEFDSKANESEPIKQEFFSNIAPEFDKHVRDSIPLYNDFVENLVHNIARFSDDSNTEMLHLDICCSTANLGFKIALNSNNYRYFGIDINDEMLNEAKNKIREFSAKRRIKVANSDFYKADTVLRFDIVTELLGFQFFTKTRDKEIDKVKSLMHVNGTAIFCEKFKTPFFETNEFLKDELHKASSFTREQIDSKKETVLSDMHDYLYKKSDFEDLLCEKFKFVRTVYVAGNFAAYVCSDCPDLVRSWDVNEDLIINEFNAYLK